MFGYRNIGLLSGIMNIFFIFSVTMVTAGDLNHAEMLSSLSPCSSRLRHDSVPAALKKNIQSFWQKTRQELNDIPINPKAEPVEEGLPYHKYFLTVQSLDHVTIAGFLSIPVQGEASPGKWPVIVTVCGYSGRGQGIMLSECQRGYAILQVYPRGQGPSAKYFTLRGDKISTGLDRPEDFYYRGGYADVMCMIDYIVTRDDIDSSHIAIAATSQGGGVALAVAALDPRIKAVVAHVPFLCNFRMAASASHSLVKTLLDKNRANNTVSMKTLDYFDPLLLAPDIHVPVLMSAGGKDEICPEQTIRSVYKVISSNKQLMFYPDLGHTTCLDFYQRMWPWLKSHFYGTGPCVDIE